MTATALAHQRCFHHAGREAVARCPRCRRNYCRECIVEHEGRIVCADCLAKTTATPEAKPAGRIRSRLASVAGAVLGLTICWMIFYIMGRLLLAIPADFHAHELWSATAGEFESGP
jgi:hypothetical protein